MVDAAFQDQLIDNYCWGCGAQNPAGLQLKSYWDGDVAVARWRPSPAHAAGPRHVLNGGIIATLLDCHGICTAVAHAFGCEHRSIGSEPEIWCVTASMAIEYLRPTPIDAEVRLFAEVTEHDGRFSTVQCRLEAVQKERARATVRAVRVDADWRHGAASTPPASV
jgi:acyl-coenzyme A thioesterase PaaI-like protein